jgi:hypothetical protein
MGRGLLDVAEGDPGVEGGADERVAQVCGLTCLVIPARRPDQGAADAGVGLLVRSGCVRAGDRASSGSY